MHVAHVEIGYPAVLKSASGIESATAIVSRALVELGHEVTTLSFSPGYFADELDSATGIRHVTLPSQQLPLRRLPLQLYLSPQAYRYFSRNLVEADVYHFHGAFYARHAFAARLLPKPYFVNPHGSYLPQSLARHPFATKAFYHLLDRHYLSRASGLLAASELEAAAIAAYCGRQPIVIPNPAPDVSPPSPDARARAREALSLTPDDIAVVFIGRLDPDVKGLDLLFEAHRRALRAKPSLRLLLAGPPHPGTALPPLPPRASLLGPLFGPEKGILLAAADAFAVPSRAEGMPLSALEAMAAGLPCLVTPATGLGEFVLAAGAGVVAEDNIEEIAAALYDLTSRHWDGPTISRRAKEHFSARNVASRLLSLYALGS